MLEEIGQPYEVTVMHGADRRTDEHRHRHPLGRVPVLEDDERFLFESVAICLQLADLYPEAQLNWPLGSRERGLVYQWAIFAMTELEQAIIDARRHREDDPARAQAGVERFQAGAPAIEQALDGHEYLVGERFSVADLVCGAVLILAKDRGLTDELPNINAYLDRLVARPARQRAIAAAAG